MLCIGVLLNCTGPTAKHVISEHALRVIQRGCLSPSYNFVPSVASVEQRPTMWPIKLECHMLSLVSDSPCSGNE